MEPREDRLMKRRRWGVIVLIGCGIFSLAASAQAGESGTVACATPACGYHFNLTIGGSKRSPSVTGYCPATKKFVQVKLNSWNDYRKPIEHPDCPKPLQPIYDGAQVAQIPCPQCGNLTLKYQEEFLFD
jgi:hypothetical protein